MKLPLKLLALYAALALTHGAAHALRADEILADPAKELRARALSAQLRCLVCQNQSIDDSDAPLARDLRLIVRERITAGDSDSAIRAFLVERYGEFVLLKPPLAAHTLVLWALPFAALGIGLAALARRGSRRQAAAPPLDADEQAALEKALRETNR